MVSGRSVKCNAIFAVYDLSALGFKTLLLQLLVCSPVWILDISNIWNTMLRYEQQTFTTLFCTLKSDFMDEKRFEF